MQTLVFFSGARGEEDGCAGDDGGGGGYKARSSRRAKSHNTGRTGVGKRIFHVKNAAPRKAPIGQEGGRRSGLPYAATPGRGRAVRCAAAQRGCSMQRARDAGVVWSVKRGPWARTRCRREHHISGVIAVDAFQVCTYSTNVLTRYSTGIDTAGTRRGGDAGAW